MSDGMREYLVIKLQCAVCGTNLKMTYKEPNCRADYAEGEPTGAAMVQTSIAVKPCELCSAETDRIKNAVSVLCGSGTS